MKIRTFLLLNLFSPALVMAGPPMKTVACADRINVRAPHNGSGVFFDEKCETAYVLPPALGKMELSGNQPTSSPEDCRELAALETARAQLAERLKQLTDRPKGSSGSGADPIGGDTGGLGGEVGDHQEDPAESQNLDKIKKDSEEIIAGLDRLRRAEKVFIETEGLVSKIIYTLDYDGMVQEYARLNPQIKSFVRLPLEKAYLNIAPKNESLKQTASEVLDYVVPGLNKMPDEEGTAPENSVYFGSALSGKVRLNQKAACLLMSKFHGKVPERLSADQFDRHMSSNITYAYGLNVRRSYYAKYRFDKLFEHISKQTQEGGFLSTRSINEVIERNNSNGWFEFQASSDDTRFPNDVLVQQLKAEMMDRVMSQIAIATVPGPATLPGVLAPGPKGADVAAAGLKKCPYTYCQVAGYVLDFVSATFGSSEAVARFLSTVGSEQVEKVDEEKTLRFIGTSTFKDRP